MSEKIADLSIGDFMDVLSSKAPVPGGGGASAVAAAVGCALGRMVASLTLGKRRYAEVEPRVRAIADRLDVLRADFLALADKDAEAFEPLSRAYGMPKDTEEERARKAEVMEAALRTACHHGGDRGGHGACRRACSGWLEDCRQRRRGGSGPALRGREGREPERIHQRAVHG